MSEFSNCSVTLNATVEGEQFSVELESREAAVAVKQALNDHGHHAGVYESCGI